MKKVTTKKTRSVNNRPNCLKITKSTQKVNFTTVIDKDGNKIKTSVREARTMKKKINLTINETRCFIFLLFCFSSFFIVFS